MPGSESESNAMTAPWMVMLAEQQKTINMLLERIAFLESRGFGPQPVANSRPPSTTAQTSAEPVSSTVGSSQIPQRGSLDRNTHTFSPGRIGTPPVSADTGSPIGFRPPSTRDNGTNSVASGKSGYVSSTTSTAGDTNKPKATGKQGKLNGQVCRYGSNCTRQACWFQHPDSEDTEPASDRTSNWPPVSNGTNSVKKPCHRGIACVRANCWYEHPAGWDPSGPPSEPPVQEEPSSRYDMDSWGPQVESSGGREDRADLSSWAETPNNDWGDTAASTWGSEPAPKHSRGANGQKAHANSTQSWGETTSSGWGESNGNSWNPGSGPSPASPTPTSSSASRGKKKSPGDLRREAERRARRQAEKDAQLAAAPPDQNVTEPAPSSHERITEPGIEPADKAPTEPTTEPLGERSTPPVFENQDEPASMMDTNEPTPESGIEPNDVVTNAYEDSNEQTDEPVTSTCATTDTSVSTETPALEPSEQSTGLSSSDSETPETPQRLVWSDEPQADYTVDFADLPSSQDPVEEPGAGDDFAGQEEPNLESTPSMIYGNWAETTSSAADWGFEAPESDWATPTPAPESDAPPPVPESKPTTVKKTVISKGKQRAIEKASAAFDFQPQNIGAPRSSSQKPVSQASELPSIPLPPAGSLSTPAETPTPVVAPEPPKGVPEEEIPSWLLGGNEDPHVVLGIPRVSTPQPSSSAGPPRVASGPKVSQMAGSQFPALDGSVSTKPTPLVRKVAPAPKPVVRARPTAWTISPNTDPSSASAWANAPAGGVSKPKPRVVRPKGKRPSTGQA